MDYKVKNIYSDSQNQMHVDIEIKVPIYYINMDFIITDYKKDQYFDNQTNIPFELIYTINNIFRFKYKGRVITNINNIIEFAYKRFDSNTYYQIQKFIFQYR